MRNMRTPGSGAHHSHQHFNVQNSVTRPHPIAREIKKSSLFGCPRRNTAWILMSSWEILSATHTWCFLVLGHQIRGLICPDCGPLLFPHSIMVVLSIQVMVTFVSKLPQTTQQFNRGFPVSFTQHFLSTQALGSTGNIVVNKDSCPQGVYPVM